MMRGYALAAGDDHFRPHRLGLLRQSVVVDLLRLLVNAVMLELKPAAGQIDRMAVGQVAAVGQCIPITLSPGLSAAKYTAWFACEPE